MTEEVIDKASSFQAARARLFALAYRMLGSRAEAEDVVQDVWLKWHLADTQGVQTPAAWLTTLTTRVAIDRLRHVQRERASQASGWLPEPWLDEAAPSAEELALRAAEMSYGVMLLLERLKPDERAAFVLHEAFDCDYAEIAKILERTPAACRQIVHRAKGRLQRAGSPVERPDPAAHARIVERLRVALEEQDRAGLLRLFSDAPEVVSDAPLCVSQPAPLYGPSVVPQPTVASASASGSNLLVASQSPGNLSVGGFSVPVPVPVPVLASAPTSRSSSQFPSTAAPSAGIPAAFVPAHPSVPQPVLAQTGRHAGSTPVFKTRELGEAEWMEKVALLARCAQQIKVVSMEEATCIALICEGEVIGVIDISAQGLAGDSPKIVALRVVTNAARLRSANRALGRANVTELLARIQRESVLSIAVRGDFPINVHA